MCVCVCVYIYVLNAYMSKDKSNTFTLLDTAILSLKNILESSLYKHIKIFLILFCGFRKFSGMYIAWLF